MGYIQETLEYTIKETLEYTPPLRGLLRAVFENEKLIHHNPKMQMYFPNDDGGNIHSV